MTENHAYHGRDVLPFLAEQYKQLYIPPSEDALKAYRDVVLSGGEPESHSLSHFLMHAEDSAVYEKTPVGPVLAVTLHERKDFETFLQIIANKCQPVEIPATQGASMLEGLISWPKIEAHRKAFLAQAEADGIPAPDWDSEFARFTSVKANYTDAMLVLSAGPYSAVDSREFGISEDQWINDSITIRRYHELNHFICRKQWPEKISAVWDELVADAVGLCAAYGRYDIAMAERFLGIRDGSYTGGRLENYVGEADPAEQQDRLNRLARKIHPILESFAEIINTQPKIHPFELIPLLENRFADDITV